MTDLSNLIPVSVLLRSHSAVLMRPLQVITMTFQLINTLLQLRSQYFSALFAVSSWELVGELET
jgi:hypothetical protein